MTTLQFPGKKRQCDRHWKLINLVSRSSGNSSVGASRSERKRAKRAANDFDGAL